MHETVSSPFMQNRKEIERRRDAFKVFVKSKNFNVPKLAAAAGIPRSTLYSYWRGETDHMLGVTETRIADVLNASIEEMFGENLDKASLSPQSPAEIELSSVPVVGKVQAGVWLEVEGFHGDAGDEERIPVVPNPRYARFKQWAVKVLGDSVNKEIPDGHFAICVDVECGRHPKEGDLVVVQRLRDGGGLVETTIKEVRENGSGLELWPCSTNPVHNGPIPLGNGQESTSVAIKGFVIGAYKPFE